MTYSEVLALARQNIGPNCKVCPECNGLACGNTLPGPGSKAPGNGAHDNWKAWRSIKLNMDAIGPNVPVDTSSVLLGKEVSMPVMTGPIGALSNQFNPGDDVVDYNMEIMIACQQRGILSSYGDGLEPRTLSESLRYGKQYGNLAMPIMNPYAMEDIKKNMDLINRYEPYAVGLVIDSAGLPHLKALNPNAGSKTVEQLRELKSYTKSKFLVKGIMDAKGAEKAVAAGADAIVVSNHGGRALAQTPATAEVLPEIVKAVKGQTEIIVDGGIRTGLDVFKALALGADGVLICRPFMISYYGGKREGILAYIDKLQAELVDTMYMCGARSIADISKEMIRY